MKIINYLSIVMKKWWIVTIFMLVAGGLSLYYSFHSYIPIYVTHATLMVISGAEDEKRQEVYTEVLAGQQLAKEYKEIIKSRAVTQRVINELNLKDVTTYSLADCISVNLKGETRILEVIVSDKSPDKSKIIADKVCEVFIDRIKELMKVENVAIVDKPEIPSAPVKPNHERKLLIGGFAGIVLAVFLILVKEGLDDTIKTAEDVEKYLSIKVIATIPNLDIE